MTQAGIVIVGAGEAGTRAALALREHGCVDPITLIGDEKHAPYERPPLSKATIVDINEPSLPTIADENKLADLAIQRLSGVRAAAIDRAAHRLVTADGRQLAYDRLCLATGSMPRQLTLPGANICHYLRTFDDAVRLRHQLLPHARIVIVGGGVIGLELAASAHQRGCSVTVLEAAPRVLTRAVPAEIADVIADRHRAAGVNLVVGAAVRAFDQDANGQIRVHVDDQQIIADCVIAGIGVIPNVALAATAHLEIDNGIAVDAQLRTADPDIFAVGDCASFPHPLFGGRRLRLEAWRNAQEQGTFAAKSLLGQANVYRAVPWFWSDQYELHLQIAGLVSEGRTVIARDLGDRATLLFHLTDDGRLVAASAVGLLGKIAKEVRLSEMLIAQEARPDPRALASPTVKLKGLLAA
jgi:3-phenylpropionate/trans-cinnamate dioxygenase ferredoxin reductase component